MGRAGELRMPDLPPGANLVFREFLFEVHVRAGAPSPGTISREMPSVTRCSRTTVYNVFSRPGVTRRDPVMAVADVLVRRVRGEAADSLLDRVDELWQAAWIEQSQPRRTSQALGKQHEADATAPIRSEARKMQSLRSSSELTALIPTSGAPWPTDLDAESCPMCDAVLFIPTDLKERPWDNCTASSSCGVRARMHPRGRQQSSPDAPRPWNR